jgi:hypothetical protein
MFQIDEKQEGEKILSFQFNFVLTLNYLFWLVDFAHWPEYENASEQNRFSVETNFL